MNYKINKKLFYLILIIIIETFAIKFFQYSIFSEKYFYDSSRILSIMNGSTLTDKTYTFTANFFNFINIFNINTLEGWSYLLSFIFTIVVIVILSKNKIYNFIESLFIIFSVALLNIYVFNLSKDLIQFLFFIVLYLIISNKKITNIKKLILASIVLILEAIFFRVYYLIMVMIMWTSYVLYNIFIKNKKIKKKAVIKLLVIAMIAFFIEVFIVQKISVDNYNTIINARYIVNSNRINSPDAITIINDLLGRNITYFTFIGNYLINLVRMMFPLELVLKGSKYILFLIYQIIITISLLKSSKKINDSNILIIISIISFLMISIIFEPDFGSFIRHESAMFIFLIDIIKIGWSEKEESVV